MLIRTWREENPTFCCIAITILDLKQILDYLLALNHSAKSIFLFKKLDYACLLVSIFNYRGWIILKHTLNNCLIFWSFLGRAKLFLSLCNKIREADISRLSFAVELAEEFYGRFASSCTFCLLISFGWIINFSLLSCFLILPYNHFLG